MLKCCCWKVKFLMKIVIKTSFTEIDHISHRQERHGKTFLTSSNSHLFFSSRLVYLLQYAKISSDSWNVGLDSLCTVKFILATGNRRSCFPPL